MASIRKNPPTRDGTVTYTVRYRLDGQNGGRTFATKAAAERWQAEVEAIGPADAISRLDGPAPVKAMPTVGEWLARFVEERGGITEGTRRDYRGYVKTDLDPAFGKLRLDALRRQHVTQWIAAQVKLGRARKTIKHRHSLLSAALTAAMYDDEVALLRNVAKGVTIPRDDHTKSEMVVLTTVELERLVGYLDPHYRPLITFLAGTGVRWGEATALLVQDVDLTSRQPSIRIRRAYKHTNTGALEVGPPKSARSLRTVPLGAGVVRAIHDLVEGRDGGESVFTTTRGTVVRHSYFHEQIWRPAVLLANGDEPPRKARWGQPSPAPRGERLGKYPRIHDLRHTHASLYLASGASMHDVQIRLGHESITTTEAVYTHLMPGWMERAAGFVDAAFAPAVLASPGRGERGL